MRKKYRRLTVLLFITLLVLYLIFYISQFYKQDQVKTSQEVIHTKKSINKHVSKLITVIFREFEPNENDVPATIQSFLKFYPNIQIYALFDEAPYPPLNVSFLNATNNVKFKSLSPALRVPFVENLPVLEITTKYVIIVPDALRLVSRQSLQTMVNTLSKYEETILVAPSMRRQVLKCLRVNVNPREWTVKYSSIKGTDCDAVSGNHVILMETEQLKRLASPFLLPFPHSLYLQSAALNIKVLIMDSLFGFREGKVTIRSHHLQWKHRLLRQEKLRRLYKLFQIKQVVNETGTIEWYGCTRETRHCLGTVLNSMPSYLFQNKWTPPCCLSNLRKTARYVFSIFEEYGVRFWLEAGSLLGAMRSGDILPWDHDVDIGFIKDDFSRCVWLQRAQDKPIVDNRGFLWEKATEGNFYRVHFSKANRMHVNIFPFYSRNGTMVKDSWFTSHKNMEFPDNFLHPMSSIEFVGRSVPSPNNIRDFLELKFGKGCIENPEYPDPSRLKFP